VARPLPIFRPDPLPPVGAEVVRDTGR